MNKEIYELATQEPIICHYLKLHQQPEMQLSYVQALESMVVVLCRVKKELFDQLLRVTATSTSPLKPFKY